MKFHGVKSVNDFKAWVLGLGFGLILRREIA